MRPVLTTLYFPRRSLWAARVQMLDRSAMSAPHLLRELLRRATPDSVVVLDGAVGPRGLYLDRVVAGLLAHWRRPPHVLVTDSTWSPTLTRRAALRCIDSPRTTYCVLSSSERGSFPRHWRVDPQRVFFTPFYWTLPDDEPAAAIGGRGVFAGGDSLRDYPTLLRAVSGLDAPVRIAARSEMPESLPSNVEYGPVPAQEFDGLLRESAVVVVPLQPGIARSAGQQTYLNAMVQGKVVIVSDVPGARDHIEHGLTGLVVPPGDERALASALRWTVDPHNAQEVRTMGERAREAALTEASPDRYVQRLLDVIDGLPV